MKIIGVLLLVLGVVFELLFILAKIGGGSIPPVAFTIAAALIAAGWKCLVIRRAASAHGKSGLPVRAGALDPNTAPAGAVLPVTPKMAAFLDAQFARGRRIMFRIGGGLATAFLAGGIAIDATIRSDSGVHAFPVLATCGVVGAGIILAIWIFFGERLARHDRKAGSYLRSTGSVRIIAVPAGNLVQVGDQAFFVNEGPAVKLLRSLPAATVDHSPHAHVIFAVRDFAGNPVYQAFE